MKINKLVPIFGVMVPIIMLSGCASDSKKNVNLNLRYMTAESAPTYSSDPGAQSQIAEAAGSVNQSMQQLSAIQIATHPGVKMPAQPNAKAMNMERSASLDWYGPVKPALQKLAKASHYKLRVLGSEPAVPVFVNISAKNQNLATILRDITYQTAGKADVKVFPYSRIIELRYRG